MEQNNITRESLSEMDRIFIPNDLDGNVSLEDLANYSSVGVKCWRTVPKNYCLVTQNVFTQSVNAVDGIGLKFLTPLFTKTILVPMMDTTKTYKNLSVTTKDGIEIGIDLDLVMKITDPAKYVTSGKYQLSQLNSLVGRLLRVYIASKKFDNVLQEECNLRQFDYNDAFRNFEDNYGIKINRVIIERVELPERLKKLYNDAAEETERRKAQVIRLEAAKEKAKADAEIRAIDAEARAKEIKVIEEAKMQVYIDKMMNLVESLKRQGVSTRSIEDYIKTLIVADKGNAIFMSTSSNSNSNAGDIANGVAAGIKAAGMKNSQQTSKKKEETNVDKLINLIDTYSIVFGDTSQNYKNMYNMLKNDRNTIEKINRLSESEYKSFVDNVFGNIDYTKFNGGPVKERK